MRPQDLQQPLAQARTAFASGDYAGALDAAQRAVAYVPDSVEALVLAVNSALRCEQLALAVPWLESLLRAHPGNPQFTRLLSTAHNNLGSRQQRAGEAAEARQSFSRALAVFPDNPEALFNRARLALDAAQSARAMPDLQRLCALRPDDASAAVLLAQAQIASDDTADPQRGRAALERLAALPGIDALHLALARADVGDATGALAVVRTISAPADVERGVDVAFRVAESSDARAARAAFKHLSGVGHAAHSLRLAIAQRLALPQVYSGIAGLREERAIYTQGIEELLADYPQAALARLQPQLEQLVWSNLLLAYQGCNDLELQRRYGQFVGRCLDACAPRLREPLGPRRPGAPRVGFLSSAFRYSTVGSYFGSWVGAASSAGYDTTVFQLAPTFDDFTDRIGRAANRLVQLDGPLEKLAHTVRDADLDLLVLPDLGVDGRIVALASLSLARCQAMAWGHPSTSGNDRIDAFLSCAEMEPPDAAQHYSERLLLLPGIGTSYAQPTRPASRTRAELGLPAGRLYLVPQPPYKMHPDTDTVLAAIAAADPDGIVVLFLSERPRSMVMLRERLRAAFFAAGARPDRQLRFIPMVARARFLEVCAACDVMVDTPHWSGGNTTIDALVAGLPVVTVPGAMMRGRQSMAMLKALGLDELVCTDAAAQVRMALQVAREPALHAHITQRVGSHLPDLLGGAAALAALRAHFATLLTGCGAFRA